jgi:hypothetical protein
MRSYASISGHKGSRILSCTHVRDITTKGIHAVKGSHITAYFRFLRASRSWLARKPAVPLLNRLAIQFELHGHFLPQPACPRLFIF